LIDLIILLKFLVSNIDI